MAPVVRRTWAPRGHTPLLTQRTRSHRKVSAIAALTLAPRRRRVGLYFTLYPDANITTVEVLRFLRHLRRQLQRPLVVVWDRLGAHHSAAVRRHLARVHHLHLEFLPPYAPDLNPVELLWSHVKTNALANYAPAEVADLHRTTRRALHQLRRRYPLLRALLAGPPLSLFA